MIKYKHIFGEENIQLKHLDTDSFLLSVNTNDIFEDLYNLRASVDFSNLNKDHELFSKEKQKVIGKFKIEIPRSIWIDEFNCLRSQALSFRCGIDNRNKLKYISRSQSKKY